MSMHFLKVRTITLLSSAHGHGNGFPNKAVQTLAMDIIQSVGVSDNTTGRMRRVYNRNVFAPRHGPNTQRHTVESSNGELGRNTLGIPDREGSGRHLSEGPPLRGARECPSLMALGGSAHGTNLKRAGVSADTMRHDRVESLVFNADADGEPFIDFTDGHACLKVETNGANTAVRCGRTSRHGLGGPTTTTTATTRASLFRLQLLHVGHSLVRGTGWCNEHASPAAEGTAKWHKKGHAETGSTSSSSVGHHVA